jgi:hypothetical protein
VIDILTFEVLRRNVGSSDPRAHLDDARPTDIAVAASGRRASRGRSLVALKAYAGAPGAATVINYR